MTNRDHYKNNLPKVQEAYRTGKFIRFAYINQTGDWIPRVTARVYGIRSSTNPEKNERVAILGILSGENTHPGGREISISKLRDVRILKGVPSYGSPLAL